MFIFKAERSTHVLDTKYYQVISVINAETNVGAVITHWGKVNLGATLLPKTHGQRGIEMLTNGVRSASNSARRNKEKRGYEDWLKVTEMNYGTLHEMSAVLGNWFKDEDRNAIIKHLDSYAASKHHYAILDDVEESNPEVMVHTVVSDPLANIERDVRWGSW